MCTALDKCATREGQRITNTARSHARCLSFPMYNTAWLKVLPHKQQLNATRNSHTRSNQQMQHYILGRLRHLMKLSYVHKHTYRHKHTCILTHTHIQGQKTGQFIQCAYLPLQSQYKPEETSNGMRPSCVH